MSGYCRENMCGAIILGGHVQALGIVRILGQKGVSAVVIESSAKLFTGLRMKILRSSFWAPSAAMNTKAGQSSPQMIFMSGCFQSTGTSCSRFI